MKPKNSPIFFFYWKVLSGKVSFNNLLSTTLIISCTPTYSEKKLLLDRFDGYRFWIFSWAVSHICANDEYRSQVGATNRPENIVIRYVSDVSLSSICSSRRFQFSFTDFALVYRSAFAQIFPRSQSLRKSNTSTNQS
jgi:hypothetical protein